MFHIHLLISHNRKYSQKCVVILVLIYLRGNLAASMWPCGLVVSIETSHVKKHTKVIVSLECRLYKDFFWSYFQISLEKGTIILYFGILTGNLFKINAPKISTQSEWEMYLMGKVKGDHCLFTFLWYTVSFWLIYYHQYELMTVMVPVWW